jgi:hypothetical protein
MGWEAILLFIAKAFAAPVVDKLWDLADKAWDAVMAWIKDMEEKQSKKTDDKETQDEIDSISNGGRPGDN